MSSLEESKIAFDEMYFYMLKKINLSKNTTMMMLIIIKTISNNYTLLFYYNTCSNIQKC